MKTRTPSSGTTTSDSTPLSVASLLLFISGAAALIYEVAWFRQMQFVFGVSSFAMGAVVAAFMLGLALGSAWASRAALLQRVPLLAYAVMELTIATYGVVFPFVMQGTQLTYVQLSRASGEGFGALMLIRFVLSLVALLPPTFAMGATLPALAQAISRRPGPSGAGILYGANTLGGVAGTLIAGFWALENLGISKTQWVAISLNLQAAAFAWAIWMWNRRGAALGFPRPRPAPEGVVRGMADASVAAARSNFAAVTLLFTGLAAMAGQVLWTRALVFYVHNSTYAFSAIVAVSLTAIALGSACGSQAGRRREARLQWLVLCLGLLAVSSIVAIGVYQQLGKIADALLETNRSGLVGLSARDFRVVDSWSRALVVIVVQVAAVVAVPSFFSGAVFPLAVGLVWDKELHPVKSIGKLYAMNAIGSVVGTLVGAFFLVDWVGTRWALLLIAAIPLLLFVWGASSAWNRIRPVSAAAAAAAAVAVLAVTVVAPPDFYRRMFEVRYGAVTWFSEGAAETVAICRHPDGSEWIHYSDGRGASGTTSYRGGWLYAHLPLLLHPDPRSAAVICFGTGNTLGAASLHELDNLVGIELSNEVVKASPIFADTNHRVADNPRVRIVIDDGRNYLLRTTRTYDVITEEPPLIHTAGVVNLYSRDFYQLCSDRLSDDGIMAVWLATWELMESETQMLVRAFVDVFPHTSAWDSMHPGEWILIGSKAPLQVDPVALAKRIESPRIQEDMQRIGLTTPADLLSLHLKGDAFLREFSKDASPVTDDRSVVDYTIPRHGRSNFGLGEGLTGGVRVAGLGPRGLLSELRVQPFDGIYVDRGGVLEYLVGTGSDSTAIAAGHLQREREAISGGMLAGIIAATAQDLMNTGLEEDAFGLLAWGRSFINEPAIADLLAMEAVLELRRGREEDARIALQRAMEVDPENRIVARLLNPSQAGRPIHLGTTRPTESQPDSSR